MKFEKLILKKNLFLIALKSCHLNNLNTHLFNVNMKSLSNMSDTNYIFENPLYTNSEAHEPAKKSFDSIFSNNESIRETFKIVKGICSNKRDNANELISNSYSRLPQMSEKPLRCHETPHKPYVETQQKHRSCSLPSNAAVKSVRFDMNNRTHQISNDKALVDEVQPAHRSRNQTASHRHSVNSSAHHSRRNQHAMTSDANIDLINDGFNCITKDGLENVFLTYFFKLPSCSPSDRTQVRIENHNILKLKIIQEKKYSEGIKSSFHFLVLNEIFN